MPFKTGLELLAEQQQLGFEYILANLEDWLLARLIIRYKDFNNDQLSQLSAALQHLLRTSDHLDIPLEVDSDMAIMQGSEGRQTLEDSILSVQVHLDLLLAERSQQ
jgi:hypothetical protein